RSHSRSPLSRVSAMGATALCGLIFLWGFGIPVLRLIWIAIETRNATPAIGRHVVNTVTLAGAGALMALFVGALIAQLNRRSTLSANIARLSASVGYALPGAVLALGGLAIAARLPGGLSSGVAIGALIWVYMARFTAAGSEMILAAQRRTSPNISHAARALGARPMRRLLRIDAPLAMPGIVAGALLLFVEILKELPATLMIRPFNWDTLAVRAYALASDERLSAAALPSLLITLAGLGPIIALSWGLSRAQTGGGAAR
ncbi:MAG: ABC transporter permease subunit, partial [Pseudomonadota bacterium]